VRAWWPAEEKCRVPVEDLGALLGWNVSA